MAEDSGGRISSEEALRERYALATAAGGVGVWDRDLATGALHLDPVIAALLGFAAGELGAEALWPGRFHAADLERTWAAEQAALAPDAPRDPDGHTVLPELECRATHRDGSTRWFLVRGRALRRADGTPYRLLGTATDITARRQAEAAARRGEQRYHALFAQASDPIFLLGYDGTIVDANVQACLLLG